MPKYISKYSAILYLFHINYYYIRNSSYLLFAKSSTRSNQHVDHTLSSLSENAYRRNLVIKVAAFDNLREF